MKWKILLIIFGYLFLSIYYLTAEKLVIFSDYPNVLVGDHWKNFFKGKSWKSYEIKEADKDYLFVYLNSYKIPDGMNWKKPSWGLWDTRRNTFLPLSNIPSNLVPVRKIGNRIFLRNKNRTAYYYWDYLETKSISKIESSVKIRGWFPKADGSITYILEDEECKGFTGARQGKLWSVCNISSDFQEIDKVISIDPCYNPMLTGDSDNYLVAWQKNLEDKSWLLEVINLDSGELKILAKSNLTDVNKQVPPKWLSWIENNWVVYEMEKQTDENGKNEGSAETPDGRNFIVHNISNDKRRKILLDTNSVLILELGNFGQRSFNYNPFLIIMDSKESGNKVKVIDVNELKVISETNFPFPYEKRDLRSVYYP